MDWVLDVNFIGNKQAFFSHPIILPQILIMYILWNVHLFPKALQEIWIRSKREYEMTVCLDLKTELHSCYGLNCVHPWLPMWWYYEVGPLGGTQVDMGFWWWSLMMGVCSPSFSLLFSLYLLPFPHHKWEHSKKRKTWCKSRISSPGTQLSTTLILHSRRSMTTCGTKRLVL